MSNTTSRWRNVCATYASVAFDARNCCSPIDKRKGSPIDVYLQNSIEIVLLGTPDAITAKPILGRMILLGIISEVEGYFKQILANCVNQCSICRSHAASQHIPFAAIDYYEESELEIALVESVSFASVGELAKHTKKLTGLDLNGQEIKAVIQPFDQICHLRHASVHARGALGSGNMRELAHATSSRQQVNLSFSDIQSIVAACHNLVRVYNRELFFRVIERWLKEHRFIGDWKSDRKIFGPIFNSFYSRIDACDPKNSYAAYQALKPDVSRFLSV